MEQIGNVNQKLKQSVTTNQVGNRTLVSKESLTQKQYGGLKRDFIKIANALIGKQYVLNDSNKTVVNDVFSYFLGWDGKYNTEKGLMLCGSYGTGKSTLMKITLKFINFLFPFNPNGFKVSSVEEIIDYDSSGLLDSEYVYNKVKNTHGIMVKKPVSLLLNEFGHDYDLKKYGSNVNDIIESFLMKRYDIFQDYGKLTHFTTNLSKQEMEKKFSPVIIDRLIEMCNIDELEGDSFRRKK